jgi:hypothetical protein
MSSFDVKGDLHDYMRGARETLVWKLEDLGEYDIRRPLTPTGTNLLGLVKHSAWELAMYFGSEVFGRSHDVSLPWMAEDAEPNADMWARPDETTDGIVALYRQTWVIADETIEELPLDAEARVWWWGDDPVTLHRVLVHVTANTQRHAGHADIIRESVDGSVGLLRGHDNMRLHDPNARQQLRDRIEEAARVAARTGR